MTRIINTAANGQKIYLDYCNYAEKYRQSGRSLEETLRWCVTDFVYQTNNLTSESDIPSILIPYSSKSIPDILAGFSKNCLIKNSHVSLNPLSTE